MKKILVLLFSLVLFASMLVFAGGAKKESPVVEEKAAPVEKAPAEIQWKKSKTLPYLEIPTVVPKKTVAIIPLFFGHDAHKAMHKQIEEFFDEVGWEYDSYNPDTKIDVQLKIIDDIIAKDKYDMVLLNPCDSGGIVGGIEKLNEAGIPVFLWDRVAYGGKIVWGTTSDSYQAGALLAQKIVDLVTAKYGDPKGVVVAMLNNPEVDTHALRIDGLNDVMGRYPDIELYSAMVPAYDPASSIKVMQDLVNKHPDAVALYSQCTFYATGYVPALKEIGRMYPLDDPKHLIYGSIDGDPYAHQQIKDGFQDVEVTHAIGEWGGVTAWAAILYAAGAELPKPGYVISAPGAFWDGSKVVMQSCGTIATLKVAAVNMENIDNSEFWGNQGEMISEYWAGRK